ncbi:uncharacterized protein LOC129720514 [Wyeomyia smithii]|uniref:uncharacterized protein LOC129720514 n=1 Tax=Wyeomyia smithii TaxID=174621 RepID=UPI0024681C1E|nr:uncharacterized protein LOC129720514 [Wyeomyia smithii]
MKIVDQWKLCCVCLNEHGSAPCKLKIKCKVGDCRLPHNQLLHPTEGAVGTSAHIRTSNLTLFQMIPVSLHGGENSITVLAFLDEGATVTLVENSLAERLGVAGIRQKLTNKWTADIARVEKNSKRMNLWVSAVGSDEKMLLKTVRTVERLMLPQQALDAEELARQFKHMRGLSIASYNGRPEMLIGLNNIHSFAPLEAKIGAVVDPIAVRCKLGWTVYGPKETNTAETSDGFLGLHHEVSNNDLHELLKTYYALEESVISIPLESAEDKRARNILEKTTQRIGDRFETGLLWKTDNPEFPDSYPMALRQLKQLEKKFEKNPELHENVCRQIDEYLVKGYAHLATPEELDASEPGKVWYLPLNVVFNPKKPGKIRLMWDAAAMVRGVSLNSQLLKGPDMLVSLLSVLAGFREKKIAIGGDLREMFHQMKIIAKDRRFQRFIFRKSPRESPRVFIMDVATFGSSSSPCSAQYVKNLNAQEFERSTGFQIRRKYFRASASKNQFLLSTSPKTKRHHTNAYLA